MAKDETKRLSTKELLNDISTNDALKSVTDYSPLNQKYTVSNIATLYSAMIAAQTVETQADAALSTARDKAVAAEWDFHNAILGSKVQVKAQFGNDSNELQTLGLKKSSEYKRPSAKIKPQATK
jgi:hypothetical protein